MPSNVKLAYATINGQRYNATFDNESQEWVVEGNGPSDSSWSQPGHKYAITLYAEDNAGNDATLTSDDETYGDELLLRVLETTKPVATIVSPTQGSILGSDTQNISLELQDFGGSGLNMESVVFKVNSVQIPNSSLSWEDSGDKKVCTYQATDLSDGSNTITLKVNDNDGNESDTASVTFIISTAAPLLNVESPTDNLVTNSNKVRIKGTATPGSEAVSIVSVTVNEQDIDPDDDGVFDYEYTLPSEGNNQLNIVATDSIGKTSTVVRNVLLDTKAPIFSDVHLDSKTINANGHFRLTFKITDPE